MTPPTAHHLRCRSYELPKITHHNRSFWSHLPIQPHKAIPILFLLPLASVIVIVIAIAIGVPLARFANVTAANNRYLPTYLQSITTRTTSSTSTIELELALARHWLVRDT